MRFRKASEKFPDHAEDVSTEHRKLVAREHLLKSLLEGSGPAASLLASKLPAVPMDILASLSVCIPG